MGKIKNKKMKFAVVALIATTVASQTVCSDDDVADFCEEGACCGYLQPAEGDAARACSDADQAAAAEYEGEDVFTCDAPVAAEESASKVILGAASLLAAVMM